MFFYPNAKKKGQEVKGEGRVLAKVKAVDSIIIIYCHPGSSILSLNFAAQNVIIDIVYIEPDT
jgi:hypothetical protein